MKKIIFLNIYKTVIASLGLAIALPLIAADTGQINYQARLLDSYGRRVNDTVDLSFKIYDAVTAGNLLWSETQAGVVVQDGVYSVVLGSQTAIPASVFSQNNIYLELGINAETMSPRQQITASAYSLVARTIMGSNIYENQTSGYVGVGTTNPAVKLEVSGTVQATGIKMTTGATAGYVLASDASGVGAWQPFSVVITAGTISNINIAVGTVTGDKFVAGTISNINIAEHAITSNKIDWTTMPASDPSQWAAYRAVTNIDMAGFSITNSAQVERWDNAVVMKQIAAGAGVTIAYSNLYYLGGSTWSNANASNSVTAAGLLGLALGDNPTANGLLLNGLFTNHWSFAPGSIIYMATNFNQITTTMPTCTSNIVRILGYVVSSTYIYFNPDRTYIQILGQ